MVYAREPLLRNHAEPKPLLAESFKEEADRKLKELAAKQEEYGALGPGDRAQLLGELLQALKTVQEDLPSLSDACVLSEGFASVEDDRATDAWCYEQITLLSPFTSFCQRFQANLQSVARTGKCTAPKALRTLDDGRVAAQVYPLDTGDKMKPSKACKAEIYTQSGKGASQGEMLKKIPRSDSVGLVLGAGNLMALGIMDCLHLLFQCNSVVLYKLHPLRTYQENFVRKLFEPLISKGYFEIVQEKNGVQDAQYLVSHPVLSHIHLTGSKETHDAIVWGPRDGRDERKKEKKTAVDLNKVKVTSELGCITPYFMCPGDWSQSDIDHHARHLAYASSLNNGYFCNSPKMLILAEGWKHRTAFLAALRSQLSSLPSRAPYYPGSHNRYAAFEKAYPNIEKIKGPGFTEPNKFGERIPWSLIHIEVDPSDLSSSKNEWAFRNEPFCPIITVCTLKGVSSTADYLDKATILANDCIWGSLSCSLIIDPQSQKDESAAFERALSLLEYGNVVVNSWSAVGYGFFECGLWGGYAGGNPPKESLENIQSGIGFVNNALAFDYPEKCVVRCPFIDKDVQVGTGQEMTRALCARLANLFINPGLCAVLSLVWHMVCISLFGGSKSR